MPISVTQTSTVPTSIMQTKNALRAALLLLLAAPASGLADVPPTGSAAASGVAQGEPLKFSAKTDGRGYIDVWQLQADVARVEPLRAERPPAALPGQLGNDPCDIAFEEDEGALPPKLKPEERAAAIHKLEAQRLRDLEAHERQKKECHAKLWGPYDAYMAAFKALNDAWLPVLLKAAQKGDAVAEVMLRQCSVSPVLDHSRLESTCDAAPERRRTAIARLKEIGFAPALEPQAPHVDGALTPEDRLALQKTVLDAIRHGNLGYVPPEAAACLADEPEYTRNSALIREALRGARQAFIVGPAAQSGATGTTENIAAPLLLNQAIILPGEMSWGPATISTVGRQAYLPTLLEQVERVAAGRAPAPKPCGPGAGLDQKLPEEVAHLLDEEDANIARYLKRDARWGVFLMRRVGHLEWRPARTAPDSLDEAWLGRWALVKSYENFVLAKPQPQGSAEILPSKEDTRIVIRTGAAQPDGLRDVEGCRLHDSGSLTPIWSRQPYGGLPPAWYDAASRGIFGLEALDRNQRYRQILMLCDEGETPGGPHGEAVRFLLLGRDTLIEIATLRQQGSPIYIRNYQRPEAIAQAAAAVQARVQAEAQQQADAAAAESSRDLRNFGAVLAGLFIGLCALALARYWAKAARNG